MMCTVAVYELSSSSIRQYRIAKLRLIQWHAQKVIVKNGLCIHTTSDLQTESWPTTHVWFTLRH